MTNGTGDTAPAGSGHPGAGTPGAGTPGAGTQGTATTGTGTPGATNTRQRIQAVALELFAEQGYDKTSLREIAERLGVTKAALYYHFKSKEDIVASLAEDYFQALDDLIRWGHAQHRDASMRAEVLTRYFSLVAEGSGVFRMLQQNQASISTLAHAKNRAALYQERLFALVDLLTEPQAPLASQLRAAVALASVSFGCMFFADRARDPSELRDAVMRVACELAGAPYPGNSGEASGEAQPNSNS